MRRPIRAACNRGRDAGADGPRAMARISPCGDPLVPPLRPSNPEGMCRTLKTARQKCPRSAGTFIWRPLGNVKSLDRRGSRHGLTGFYQRFVVILAHCPRRSADSTAPITRAVRKMIPTVTARVQRALSIERAAELIDAGARASTLNRRTSAGLTASSRGTCAWPTAAKAQRKRRQKRAWIARRSSATSR